MVAVEASKDKRDEMMISKALSSYSGSGSGSGSVTAMGSGAGAGGSYLQSVQPMHFSVPWRSRIITVCAIAVGVVGRAGVTGAGEGDQREREIEGRREREGERRRG